ncbi:MAG: SET domain-containing protein [Chitinophagaceae bacterium]
MIAQDNPKIILERNHFFGRGVFANDAIAKDEIIAVWDGDVYEASKNSELPNDAPLMVADHAIQFDYNKWRDSNGLARYINHSCEPNCGIKGLFTIVAMRNIKKGEEITWDYEMTENSDWEMDCQCGCETCRQTIRAYRFLPPSVKSKYENYTSDWLKQ